MRGQLREVSVKNLHELRNTHRFNLNNKLLLRLIPDLTRLNDQIISWVHNHLYEESHRAIRAQIVLLVAVYDLFISAWATR